MTKAERGALVRRMQTLELTDAERKKAEGSFIDLPCGNTHYELKGNGEAVVLTHGYATPYFLYDRVFDRLVAEGYKALRYDLLGRGLSERVDAVYDPALFARQLDELTKALLGDEKFYLFGTSMGGTITTAFCASHPDRVKKLILFAPAGMDTFKPPFYMKLSSIPILGDLVFHTVARKTLLTKCAGELKYSSQDVADAFMRKFAYCAQYKGFLRCTLSSLRHTILATEEATRNYITCAKHDLPMLCVWGTDDRTMPYDQCARMREIYPTAKYQAFENSGHIFLYDEGDRTMEVVLPFLKA